MVIPSLLCLAFYLLASLAAIHRLLDSQATRWPLLSCAWIAMALHAGGLGPSLLAQGLGAYDAACLAVWLHARAGEQQGQLGRGLAASDLIPAIRQLLEEHAPCTK